MSKTKELSAETKERIRKKAIEDVTMITLTHGIKIETLPSNMVKAFLAVYSQGLAQGVRECIDTMNEPINPDDIPF